MQRWYFELHLLCGVSGALIILLSGHYKNIGPACQYHQYITGKHANINDKVANKPL